MIQPRYSFATYAMDHHDYDLSSSLSDQDLFHLVDADSATAIPFKKVLQAASEVDGGLTSDVGEKIVMGVLRALLKEYLRDKPLIVCAACGVAYFEDFSNKDCCDTCLE